MFNKRNRNVLGELLTPEELCSLLKIKKQRLYDWVQQGRILSMKVGRFLRFSISGIKTR